MVYEHPVESGGMLGSERAFFVRVGIGSSSFERGEYCIRLNQTKSSSFVRVGEYWIRLSSFESVESGGRGLRSSSFERAREYWVTSSSFERVGKYWVILSSIEKAAEYWVRSSSSERESGGGGGLH